MENPAVISPLLLITTHLLVFLFGYLVASCITWALFIKRP